MLWLKIEILWLFFTDFKFSQGICVRMILNVCSKGTNANLSQRRNKSII